MKNYDVSTGSFNVQTDVTACAVANAQGLESYTFTAYTDAFSKEMQFTVYFKACQDVSVVAIKDFEIVVYLIEKPLKDPMDFSMFTDQDIGFESSDEANCPLKDIIWDTVKINTFGNFWVRC